MTFETFHGGYWEGQRLAWGDQPGLLKSLEGLGGGLPGDEPWSQGGPLLVGFNGRQILAWMRTMPGRVNAWEAWGIIGPAGSFTRWPTLWSDLSAPPDRDRLDRLAATFADRRHGSGPPPIPPDLTRTLESLYFADKVPPIAMHDQQDLPLLAWAFLLGPVAWESATVGPPRRILQTSTEPLTYQGKIMDGPKASPADWSSPLLAEIVRTAEKDPKAACDLVKDLRALRPDERRRRLTAPRAKPVPPDRQEKPVPQHTTSSAPSAQDTTMIDDLAQKISNLRIGLVVALAVGAVLLVLSAGNTYYLFRIASATEALVAASALDGGPGTGKAASLPDPALTLTSGTSPATSTVVISCSDWWTRAGDRALVLEATRGKIAENGLTPVAGAARALAPGAAWDEANSPAILANTYTQVQLRLAQCYGGPIDGDAGQGTQSALSSCAGRVPAGTREETLQRLCAWAQP